MKKTLFILLALGSVAAAGTSTSTYTGTDSTSQTEEETSPNKYQVDENGNITTVFEVNGKETVYTNDFPYEVEAGYDNDSTADGKIYNAVHIGNAGDYGKVTIHSDANNAESYVVNEGGTLVFVGETRSNGATTTTRGITAESFLTTTTGSGNLVLRTPDQDINASQLKSNALTVDLEEKSQFTGNLIISPVPTDGNSLYQQSHVNLKLGDGADVSSFESVMIGSAKTAIYVEGEVGKTTDAAHIRNLTLLGSSDAYLNLNTDVNGEFVLGGVTKIEPYTYTGSSECDSALNVDFDVTTKLRIEKLTGSAGIMNSLHFTNGYQKQNDASITTTDVVGSFNIESFDFRGTISLDSYISGGTIEGRINLERNDNQGIHQKLYDYQLQGYVAENATDVTQKVELDGQGTYVLSEGIAITPRWFFYTYNFATLADDWTGTVEVNKLTADIDFTKYGNKNSTVHFRGFNGALEGGDAVSINTNLKLENVEGMYAYELTGTPGDTDEQTGTPGDTDEQTGTPGDTDEQTGTPGNTAQAQTYNGSISGDGDFVLNSETALDITFTGDLSGWTAANDTATETPELLASKGAHKVAFSGNVEEINADVLTGVGSQLDVNFTRRGETTVNGKVSHQAGGTMNLGVAQGTTVTFNDTVDVNTAAISGTAKIAEANTLTAGSVIISGRTDASVATLGSGVQVSANSVSGGTVAQSLVDLKSGSSLSVSDVVMSDTTVTADAGQTVKLSGVTADKVFYNNVVLSGSNVSYIVQPAVTDKFIAAEDNIRKISMSTSALSGMTLAADANAQITLADSSVSGWTADNMPEVGKTLEEITIVLNGFVMDYVVQEGTVSGALATLETDTWLDGLSLNNTVLNRLDLSGATITYSQNFYNQETDDIALNTLTITIKNATYAIPEPTTATLSLLALAGLAARRRRR